MRSTPKTVLVADDEPAVRRLLQRGMQPHLPDFEIVTVGHGQEAIDYMSAHPVEVLVTDIHMPVKDGFEVLAYVRRHRPNMAVVVLATMTPDAVAAGAPGMGAIHVVQKPASADLVARHVIQARAESARGRMTGVPLATVLRLMQAERKTCSLLIHAGDQRGRLHFLSGDLVNAYSFQLDAEGEKAARHLLALSDVTIDFERSLHNDVRRVHTPLETLLIDVATRADEAARDRARVAAGGAAADAALTRDLAGGTTQLDAALSGLQGALASLRDRTRDTGHLLDGATPEFTDAIDRLAREARRAPDGTPDRERLDAARAQVAALAVRLLAATEPSTTAQSSPNPD